MTETEIQKLKNVTGFVHHTESFGAVDGPGIRFVFFLQGCPLRCLYCHNPDSRDFGGGELWTAGRAADEVLRYKNFISSGGVTFSGGEPLSQPSFIYAVSVLLALHGINAVIDTSGGINLSAAVRQAIDTSELILLDIKAADDDTAVLLTGQSLTNAYKMLDYCEQTGKDVWIRHVLLSGYTLDNSKLSALAEKLTKYKCIKLIELLPFHKLGEHKWTEDYKLHDTPATTKEELESAKKIFTSYGFAVQ